MHKIKAGQIYKGSSGHLKIYTVTPLAVYYKYIDGPIKGDRTLTVHQSWIINHTKLDVFKTFKSLIKRNND